MYSIKVTEVIPETVPAFHIMQKKSILSAIPNEVTPVISHPQKMFQSDFKSPEITLVMSTEDVAVYYVPPLETVLACQVTPSEVVSNYSVWTIQRFPVCPVMSSEVVPTSWVMAMEIVPVLSSPQGFLTVIYGLYKEFLPVLSCLQR